MSVSLFFCSLLKLQSTVFDQMKSVPMSTLRLSMPGKKLSKHLVSSEAPVGYRQKFKITHFVCSIQGYMSSVSLFKARRLLWTFNRKLGYVVITFHILSLHFNTLKKQKKRLCRVQFPENAFCHLPLLSQSWSFYRLSFSACLEDLSRALSDINSDLTYLLYIN